MTTRKNDPQYPNPYASGGHKEPVAHATHGKKFRVRNDDHPVTKATKVWHPGLPYQDALKLKEKVCGARKSTNAILEDAAIPFPPPVQQVVAAPPPPPPAIQHPGVVPQAPTPAPAPAAPANDDGGELEDLPIVTESGDADLDSLIDDVIP